MKRIYEDFHIEHMKDFLKKYLNSALKPDVDLDIQATKHVQYLDKNQLKLLVAFFNTDKLPEEELTSFLSKIGFFSKINIYEKRAIFTDFSRNTLLKIIKYNDSLIDYELLKQNKLSTLKPSLLKACKRFKKRFEEAYIYETPVPRNRIDSEDTKDKEKPLFFNPLNPKSINTFFTPQCLRSVPLEKLENHNLDPKTEKIVNIRQDTDTPGTRKITIYDKIDNPNIILRRKKSLYLEHSGPIDYHNDQENKLVDISPKIKELPEYSFESESYKNFNLIEFVNKILFVNNGLDIPTVSKYTDHIEFRKLVKGNLYFVKSFLKASMIKLIMNQDKFLSFSDAKFLFKEIRKVIELPVIEYFYDKYLNSSDFRYAQPMRNLQNYQDGEIDEESLDIDEIVSRFSCKKSNLPEIKNSKANQKIEVNGKKVTKASLVQKKKPTKKKKIAVKKPVKKQKSKSKKLPTVKKSKTTNSKDKKSKGKS